MTPADLAVAVGLLAAAVAVAASLRLGADGAARAAVRVGREIVVTLPLDRDVVQAVQGRLGPVTLQVAGGAIRITESGCAQRICVAMGAKRAPGEIIACVPNAVIVQLEGGGLDPDTPDAVSR